ncbi:pre-mRNA cleavage complex II protein family [Striga asiatica]|uniref:Pre-mRNA cleavage complex II protein family n=1 Tax=Striga asiatica TaxID=4170 RepID=A0A5A7QBI6_STRAF|nr:pre-mRNA cleavage complex II protein family [Striga asiatica]
MGFDFRTGMSIVVSDYMVIGLGAPVNGYFSLHKVCAYPIYTFPTQQTKRSEGSCVPYLSLGLGMIEEQVVPKMYKYCGCLSKLIYCNWSAWNTTLPDYLFWTKLMEQFHNHLFLSSTLVRTLKYDARLMRTLKYEAQGVRTSSMK